MLQHFFQELPKPVSPSPAQPWGLPAAQIPNPTVGLVGTGGSYCSLQPQTRSEGSGDTWQEGTVEIPSRAGTASKGGICRDPQHLFVLPIYSLIKLKLAFTFPALFWFFFHAVNHERNTPECRSTRAEHAKHPRAASHAAEPLLSWKGRAGIMPGSHKGRARRRPRRAGPGRILCLDVFGAGGGCDLSRGPCAREALCRGAAPHPGLWGCGKGTPRCPRHSRRCCQAAPSPRRPCAPPVAPRHRGGAAFGVSQLEVFTGA